MGQIFASNTNTFIADADRNLSPFAPRRDRNSAVRRRIFQRVVEQIDQNLLQQERVGAHRGDVGRNIDQDQKPVFLPRDRRFDHFGEFGRCKTRHDLAALEAGHVGDIGEKTVHAGGIVLDAAQEITAGLRRELRPGGAQRLGGAADGGERRAEIVRE